MRGLIIVCVVLLGCTNSKKAGEEEARREAERAQKEKEATGGVAKVIRPPVPGMTKIPCTQLLDVTKFQEAIAEKEPMTMVDESKKEVDAASSCSLIRGGKKVTPKEQEAILKKEPRLGVLPGDTICNITAFCSTIEDPQRFKEKCKARKDRDDDTMGTYACVQVVAQGIDDVQVFRFFDEDTKCIVQVRGGPSNNNNDLIRKCATTARDMIGPAQIAVTTGTPTEPPPAGSGSGSGS